jgi:hypothetical protein
LSRASHKGTKDTEEYKREDFLPKIGLFYIARILCITYNTFMGPEIIFIPSAFKGEDHAAYD